MSVKPEDIAVTDLHDNNVTAAERQKQMKQIRSKLIELLDISDESD